MTGDVLLFERAKKHQGQNMAASANNRKRVRCLNDIQRRYYLSLKTNVVTFATGPAGCGKSWIALGRAAELLMDKEIDQIIITRPMVQVDADDKLGFLPGEVEDKVAPYFAPMRAILEDFLGYSHLEALIRVNKVVMMPLQFIRGHTLSNSFILLDEAQNASCSEVKALLTRIGEHTTIAIDGDVEQIDLKGGASKSGLVDAMKRFCDNPSFGRIEFDIEDVVRSRLCREVIEAYRKGPL